MLAPDLHEHLDYHMPVFIDRETGYRPYPLGLPQQIAAAAQGCTVGKSNS